MNAIHIHPVNYNNQLDQTALTRLLNHYAQDPMGGGESLAADALARLCSDLAQRPYAFSFIAWRESEIEPEPIGLVNCFEAYSTFKARPLINIHDMVIQRDWRGKGIAQQLMGAVEQEATKRGACKITLEVLSNNHVALQSYQKFGFAPYELDPDAGQAMLMQKWL